MFLKGKIENGVVFFGRRVALGQLLIEATIEKKKQFSQGSYITHKPLKFIPTDWLFCVYLSCFTHYPKPRGKIYHTARETAPNVIIMNS